MVLLVVGGADGVILAESANLLRLFGGAITWHMVGEYGFIVLRNNMLLLHHNYMIEMYMV